MNKEACGIDVCLDVDTIKSAPHCPHGPSLLFERYVDSGKQSVQRFYACSASRDRKYCSFFQFVGDKKLERTHGAEVRGKDWILFPYTHNECVKRLTQIKSQKPHERRICKTCGLLLFSSEVKQHNGHHIQCSVTDIQLLSPTKLLQPLSNSQTNAQFLFSDKTIKFFKGLIQKIGVKRVLCVGTPRIYEALVGESGLKDRPKCLLIDIDQRFEQFYSPQEFCRYNMFNHHFFNGSASFDVYLRFIRDPSHCPNDLLVVLDPPFGGLVDVLALSLLRIGQDFIDDQMPNREYLPQTIWAFPYFMEPRIVKKLSSFTMLDYRVEYENASNRSKGDNKIGTMVRLFTNLDPSTVVLPSNEGYRFCSICKKYVAAENKHCVKCKACTTKSGKTYKHCGLCDRCVKPAWQHCGMCETCEVPGQHLQLIKLRGCHNCGQMDHKRQNCPSRERATTSTTVSSRTDGRGHSRKRKRQSSSKTIDKRPNMKR